MNFLSAGNTFLCFRLFSFTFISFFRIINSNLSPSGKKSFLEFEENKRKNQ